MGNLAKFSSIWTSKHGSYFEKGEDRAKYYENLGPVGYTSTNSYIRILKLFGVKVGLKTSSGPYLDER